MPFVVTENCINCKTMHCVEVCPASCFHEGPNFVVIDPDRCIDCSICPSSCPANAIFEGRRVPPEQRSYIRLNAELARVWPVVTAKKSPPPDWEEWDEVPDKLKLLEQ